MYKKYFGFKDKPFKLIPDPAYLYRSPFYDKALKLFYTLVDEKTRLVVFTGGIGSGKTVLLRSFAKKLPDEIETLQVNYAGDDRSQFLQVVLHSLGAAQVDSGSADVDTLRKELKTLLVDRTREGGILICVIDEAQNLGKSALDEAWRMLALEVDGRRPVRMLLAGLPKLREILVSLKKVDLLPEEILSYHLELLPEDEVLAYICHRLSVAGNSNTSVFSEEAVKDIARASGGTPRLINIICDSALLNAYFMEEKSVTPAIVKDVFDDVFYKAKSMEKSLSSSSIGSGAPQFNLTGNQNIDSAYPEALKEEDGEIVAKVYEDETVISPEIENARSETPGLLAVSAGGAGVQLLDKIIDFADSLTGLGVSRDAAMGAFRDYVGADESVEKNIEPVSESIPLSILLLENNARMRIHIENKFQDVGFNLRVLTDMNDLFEALRDAEGLEIQVLVADAGYFLQDGKTNDLKGQEELKHLRADYAHVPLVMTSVMPLTSIRAKLMQMGVLFLLHKPDLGRIDPSQIRREFSKFFQELYGSVLGIQSLFNAFYRRASSL